MRRLYIHLRMGFIRLFRVVSNVGRYCYAGRRSAAAHRDGTCFYSDFIIQMSVDEGLQRLSATFHQKRQQLSFMAFCQDAVDIMLMRKNHFHRTGTTPPADIEPWMLPLFGDPSHKDRIMLCPQLVDQHL